MKRLMVGSGTIFGVLLGLAVMLIFLFAMGAEGKIKGTAPLLSLLFPVVGVVVGQIADYHHFYKLKTPWRFVGAGVGLVGACIFLFIPNWEKGRLNPLTDLLVLGLSTTLGWFVVEVFDKPKGKGP